MTAAMAKSPLPSGRGERGASPGPRPRRAFPWTLCGLALAYAAFMLLAGRTEPGSWLDASILDAAYSLVHSHSLSIEDSPFPTGDRLLIRGKMQAARLPLVQIVAAAVYLPLHQLFGVDLGVRVPDTAVVYRSIAFVMSVLPAVGCMVLVRGLALRWGVPPQRALAAAALTGFGTLLFPFGAVIGYHTLCAFLLLAALRLLEPPEPDGTGGRWRFSAAGFTAGLITSVDAVTGPIVGLALLAGIFIRRRPATIPFLAGLGLAAALHVALNLLFSGRPLPFSVYGEFFEYPGSPFAGGTRHHFVRTLPTSFYLWRSTLGSTGFFSLSPVTLALAAVALRSRKRRLPPAAFGVYLAGACLACFGVFLVVFPESLGWSYGPRHLIPWYPMMVLWGMAPLEGPLSPAAQRVLTFLAVVSFLLVAPGVLEPYSREGFRRDSAALIPARAPFAVVVRHFESPG